MVCCCYAPGHPPSLDDLATRWAALMSMSRLQRCQKLRSVHFATGIHPFCLRITRYSSSLQFALPLHSTRVPTQCCAAPLTMAEPDPSSNRDAPSFAMPPAPRRVSDRMWSPENGIVFAKSPSSATGRPLIRAISDGRVAAPIPGLHRRAQSNSSLESLGRDARITPEQQPTSLPSISRIRSNDELRVPKQRRRTGAQPARPFSTTSQRPTTHKQTPKPAQVPTTQNSPMYLAHNILESFAFYLRHWTGLLLGLPSTSLSFAGSGNFMSTWSNIFGSTPEPPQESIPVYWTYETEARKTGVMPIVKLCTDRATSDKVAAEFLNETIVGFDLEWDSTANSSAGPKRNISLVQVAKKDLIALFQIARFSGENSAELMPPNLKLLIEKASILKTGVNIAGDCTRLRNHFHVDPKGIFELSHAYRLVKYHDGPIGSLRLITKKLVSLATQAEEHLGLPLFKDLSVRSSDWTQPLSAQQTLYAASDAYACYRLFHILDEKRAAMDPAPPRPAAHERGQPIRLAGGQTVAEYLADHHVDTAIVQEVIRNDTESDSESAEELDLGTTSSESAFGAVSDPELPGDRASSNKKPKAVKGPELSRAEEQLIYAASVFAEEQQAKLEASSGGGRKPLRRQLQAYFLWHTKALDVSDAARVLLVKPSSIACYALEAIAVAKLPVDQARVQKEILPQVPPRVLKARFWMFDSLKDKGRNMDHE